MARVIPRWYPCSMRYVLALLVALMGSEVATQPAPAGLSPAASEAFKAVIGKWEISNADRDRTCTVTFRSDPSGSAFKIEMDKACPTQLPEVKDVVAWTIGGLDLVRLIDGKGKPVMEFTETVPSVLCQAKSEASTQPSSSSEPPA